MSLTANLVNLASLELIECNDFFRNWIIKNTYKEYEVDVRELEKLTHVSFAGTDIMDEYQFNRIMRMAPNVESIDISNCFRKINDYRRVAMIGHVMRFINRFKFQIKKLHFSGTLSIDDLCLSNMAEMDGLQLTDVKMSYCDKIAVGIVEIFRRKPELLYHDLAPAIKMKFHKKLLQEAPGISDFLDKQNHITHLDLTSSLGLTDDFVLIITTKLLNLVTLKLARCFMITDRGISEISLLNKLEVLDLSHMEKLSDTGVFDGAIGRRPKMLKELYFQNMSKLSDWTIMQVTLNCPHIKVLDLTGAENAATDSVIQYASFYLTNLEQLLFGGCEKVGIY